MTIEYHSLLCLTMGIYIQIGAGAGDLDPAANFRDGFTSHVKALDASKIDRIVVVEANKLNIETLKECWRKYPQVEVKELAISPTAMNASQFLEFFYCERDAPHFQISSLNKHHVAKFYSESEISSFKVQSMSINSFLESLGLSGDVELLAIDIEGLDLEIMTDLDLRTFCIHKISFEESHGDSRMKSVKRKLREFGYCPAGMGMDPHNSDALWVKPTDSWERTFLWFRNVRHILWEIQIPTRHKIKKRLKSLRFDKNS